MHILSASADMLYIVGLRISRSEMERQVVCSLVVIGVAAMLANVNLLMSLYKLTNLRGVRTAIRSLPPNFPDCMFVTSSAIRAFGLFRSPRHAYSMHICAGPSGQTFR